MSCPAFELLFGGSKGGSKTNYLAAAPSPILQLAHRKFLETGKKQHCRIMVFRKNLDDLKDFLAKTFDIYPYLDPQMGASGYNKNEKTWYFTSGATVELRHLDGPTDHLGFNGNEFVALLFDEVQFIPYEAYSFLLAQVRSSDPDYQKVLMVRSTCNPGGPYGAWVKRHFLVDTHPKGGVIHKIEVTNGDGSKDYITRAFIRASLKDNPHLPKNYETQLRATMTPDEVRMFIDGDFDVVAGSFFASLVKPTVHFMDAKWIPSSWEMIMGIDWGSSAPAACYIAAKNPDGIVYVIDELHGPGVTGRTFGERLKHKFATQKWAKNHRWKVDDFFGVIDKQAMDNYGSEATAADGIMDAGFRLFAAKKDRAAGVNQIKERLLVDPSGKPAMVIFADRCPKLVDALKSITSLAPKEPDNYDPHSPHAHAIDALRFLLMEWPVVPRPQNTEDKELAAWEAMIRRHRAKASTGGSSSSTTGYGD